MHHSLLVVLACAAASTLAAPFNLNLMSNITTSGISAGGFFALQYAVGFSGTCNGAAIFAGGPVYCSQGSLSTALTDCMSTGFLLNVATLVQDVQGFAQMGQIDPLQYLANDRFYFYSGQSDYTVVTQVVQDAIAQLQAFGVPSANIASQFSIDSGHGVPTTSYGVTCDTTASPYLMDCQYDGVGAAFKQLFGTLKAPTTPFPANIQKLQTSQFTPNGAAPDDLSLGNTAYVYIPTACAAGAKCRLHIAFHGCAQADSFIGNVYYMHAGYLEWAESNNIVVLFPQAAADFSANNPNGCFDWWGYLNDSFYAKSGAQMTTFHNMVQYLGAQK